jgi:hypothetical protein
LGSEKRGEIQCAEIFLLFSIVPFFSIRQGKLKGNVKYTLTAFPFLSVPDFHPGIDFIARIASASKNFEMLSLIRISVTSPSFVSPNLTTTVPC